MCSRRAGSIAERARALSSDNLPSPSADPGARGGRRLSGSDLPYPAPISPFLSVEPLLAPIALNLDGISWCILGGESGPRARPMHPDWARDIRDQCREAGVRFFMKQMSGRQPIPADLRVRQFPQHGQQPASK